ncbi:ABC transporter ATP-binding protein [Halalkalibacter sp. APA_J-10(15)]|uniref:ABC transporter ATP-binding protein n=1 Tax=Halalkalibacter sp. APA_J-10(15) TaxID=2933805 RepID=UPI001FF13D47|nr:ABC transporter ATP-binding protein [Halalkalibacter sp. APA_J-10(15)]MCK0473720.1 ABC transporter ATP-binding protein [Halalkalibacter sp. APA_J-10(15)]
MTKSTKTILQVNQLHVRYQQKRQSFYVLQNLTFDIKEGEIVTLLGESGSGKSTLAKALTGLLPPSAYIDNGTLQIGSSLNIDLRRSDMGWNNIRGKEIGMIFQDAQQALNPVLTIREHFRELLLYHQLASPDEVITVSTNLLNKLNFTHVPDILNSYPHELSGGMCQRICIALTLCLKPKVMIADEPTSALDTVNQKEVLHLLKKMQEEWGLSVLFITHDIAAANAISHQVIVLNKGVIVEKGDSKMVLNHPQSLYTRQLLSARSLIANHHGKFERLKKRDPILEIKEVDKSFDQKTPVLSNVNLTLHRHEILGILGQSGCGKSTLAKCITGLEKTNQGQILYNGTDICRLKGKAKREVCKHIQLVFQDARASLNPGRTALQLVQEPLRYFHIWKRKEREDLATFYLNQVGISDETQNRRPPQLSTGQCQRVAIARALILKPDILICDEAVSALDMTVQSQILSLLQRLHSQFGFSILMISHDIQVLRYFCHTIAVLQDGQFSKVSPANSLAVESEQSSTQRLLSSAYDLEESLK